MIHPNSPISELIAYADKLAGRESPPPGVKLADPDGYLRDAVRVNQYKIEPVEKTASGKYRVPRRVIEAPPEKTAEQKEAQYQHWYNYWKNFSERMDEKRRLEPVQLPTEDPAIKAAHDRKSRLDYEWKNMCPAAYRETDAMRIPSNKLNSILAWEYGPRGLVVIGPSRTFKTRSVWQLLHRMHYDEHRIIEAFDGLSWPGAVQSALMGNGIEQFNRRMRQAEILFIDDMFKGKITETQEAAFYGVLEMRTANKLPVILTINATGSTLKERFSAERFEPVMLRLREFCDIITFEADNVR